MIGRWIAARLVYKIFKATETPGERPEDNRFLWIWILVLVVVAVGLWLVR